MADEVSPANTWLPKPGRSENEVWLERRVADQWVTSFRVVRDGQYFSIVEARVAPHGDAPADGLSAQLLRDAMTSRGVVAAARAALGDDDESGWQARLRDVGAHMPSGQRDIKLALIAYGYSLACRSGSRSPNVDVAAAFDMETTEVTRGVFAARECGYLTGGGGRGIVGGESTGLADKVLVDAAQTQYGITDKARPMYFMFESEGPGPVASLWYFLLGPDASVPQGQRSEGDEGRQRTRGRRAR